MLELAPSSPIVSFVITGYLLSWVAPGVLGVAGLCSVPSGAPGLASALSQASLPQGADPYVTSDNSTTDPFSPSRRSVLGRGTKQRSGRSCTLGGPLPHGKLDNRGPGRLGYIAGCATAGGTHPFY